MFVEHDNCRFHVVSFGAGDQTIVAIGGWAGSWELWLEPFSSLSAKWRTVGYDHRGTGATVAAPESITLDAMVHDLFAILDTLQVERCILAAESSGVATALMAVLAEPHRFSGLVLVDGVYYRPPLSEPDKFLLGLEHAYEPTLSAFVDLCLTERDDDAVRQWGRKIVGRCSQDAAIRLHTSTYGLDLRASLPAISLPTLVIHGADDRIVPVDSSRWLAGQIPNSHLYVVPGAGHVPTVTHGLEVAKAIDSWYDTLASK